MPILELALDQHVRAVRQDLILCLMATYPFFSRYYFLILIVYVVDWSIQVFSFVEIVAPKHGSRAEI